MSETTPLEALIRRDRAITIAGLVAISIIAWVYVLTGSGTGMSVTAMTTLAFPPPALTPGGSVWGAGTFLVMLAMWWVMMIAMMAPTAAPVVLLYAEVVRNAQAAGRLAVGPVPVTSFVLGYLIAWLAFSLVATVAQWGLETAGLLSGLMMWSTSRVLSGTVLIAAGLYQLTPWKDACLHQCRSPIGYLTAVWKPGRIGALAMGWRHGLFCVGCCWLLMALLFVGGTMNLVWMAALTLLALLEKVAPGGRAISRVAGVAMLALAGYVLWQ